MKESAILESSAIVADVLGAPAVAQVNARILCELMDTIYLEGEPREEKGGRKQQET